MAEAESEELKQLKSVFKQAKLPEAIQKWLHGKIEDGGLGMESWQDFYGYVKAADFEDELQTLLQTKDEFKDNPLFLSRLRAAWRLCESLEKEAVARKTSPSTTQEQLDLPLSDDVKEELETAWDNRYHLTLDVKIHPADTLVARKFREIRKNSHEVDNVRKVKTLFHTSKPSDKQRTQIGEAVVETGKEVEVQVRRVVDYYFGLRTLAYAQAKAGNHLVDSKIHPGQKVNYADLSEYLDYADSCLRNTAEKGLNESESLLWMEEMDSLTRGTMVSYMRRGWPQCEALKQARREHMIDWRVQPRKRGRSESPPKERKPKVAATVMTKTGLHFNGREVCKPHNDPRGCTRKESQCPNKRAHVCDVLKDDGKVCGSATHTRSEHK